MTVEELLDLLRRRGILLEDAGGRLRVDAPADAVDDEIVAALREHKPRLLARLSQLTVDDTSATADLPPLVTDPVGRHEPFPLTDIQQAYWVGREGGVELGAAIHVYVEMDCPAVDLELLQGTWNRLVTRHEMLRAVVSPTTGEQRILAAVPTYEMAVEDLRARPPAEVQAALAAVRDRMSHQVLPLDTWPLFELRAARLPDGVTRVFLDVDCTLIDSWGVQLLFRELATAYHDPDAPLPAVELSFRDYVLSAAALVDSPAHQRAAAYWDRRLPDLPPAPQLPRARLITGADRPAFRRWDTRMDARAFAGLGARAVARGLTPTSVLISAYAEVMGRWASSPRFTLNVPLFNRLPLHPDVNHVLGTFSSFTLLEVDHRNGVTFTQRAAAIHRRLLEDLDHRHAAGVRLIRQLNASRGAIGGAAMPVVFTSFASGVDGLESFWIDDLGAAFGEVVHAVTQTPQVWIDQQVLYQHGGLYLNWDAAESLFPPGLLDGMFEAYADLLTRLATDDATWEDPAPLAVDPPADPTATADVAGAPLVHQPIMAHAAADPGRPAVIAGGTVLTYGELAERAGQLTAAMAALQVPPAAPVAAVLPSGIAQAVAALAALLSGRPYMPIDPALPPRRLTDVLAAAGAGVVLIEAARAGAPVPEAAPGDRRPGGSPPPWRTVEGLLAEGHEAPPSSAVTVADDPVCVIHTSGTTGLPAGVVLTHRGLRNAIAATGEAFAVGPTDRALALTPAHHDMALYDLFGVLSAGGAVVVPDPDRRRDPSHWVDLLVRHDVTIWNSVPAMAQMLLDHLGPHRPLAGAPLRLAFLGGDWIPLDLPDRFREHLPALRVISVGGPTETTLWNIWFPVGTVEEDWASIPYGRPIPGVAYHVLDESLRERPTWAAGELYCSGVSLAAGYLGRPELTAERFVHHPHSGARMYRTGDLGRRRPDGVIEILGRVDLQLSIDGRRIEPAEIEASLVGLPGVGEAIVVGADTPAGTLLTGFYTVRAEGGDAPAHDVTPDEVAARLAAELPPHLIPRRLVPLAAIPLTANGKADRAELTARATGQAMRPGTAVAHGSHARIRRATVAGDAPTVHRTSDPGAADLLVAITSLLAEVLGTEAVDARTNFFELGATSVHLVRLHGLLRDRMGLDVAVTDLFQHANLQTLAAHLSSGAPGGQAAARQVAPAHPPASAADAVAIIGLSCRFPDAPDVAAFWANLIAGRESVRTFTDAELTADGIAAEVLDRPDYVKAGAVLDDIAGFDAELFGLTAREAELTDPQQRIFLECAWEALESAGYPPGEHTARVGVFAGKSISNYLFPVLDLADPINYFQILFGNDKDYIATQTSYLLDLTGPSVAMQTACSTSLVTLDAACAALRAGSCDLALSGGASIKIPHHSGYDGTSDAGLFSPDGHTRPFDAAAAGTVPGSGVGVVALKLLSRAVADGDHIHAVVRGIGVTNDGRGKVGFTAPSVDGQRRAIEQAHAAAGVTPDQIGYVEAHGTGTPLGDPIEIAALTQAFGDVAQGACAIGSVKSNIGHLDSAAGVAGLIKATLALEHQVIPASLNFSTPNPAIDLAASPFRVAEVARPWPRGEHPRHAGVSAFGVGGTNVHVVLEEAPVRPPAPTLDGPVLLPLSARTPEALQAYAGRWERFLAEPPAEPCAEPSAQAGLHAAVHTAQVGRRALAERATLVAADTATLRARCADLAAGRAHDHIIRGTAAGESVEVAMLFTGHGGQYAGMASGLLQTEPRFRDHLLHCEEVLGDRIGGRLTRLLDGRAAPANGPLGLVAAQTALFAVETGLAAVWQDWGIRPAALMGHSLGEIVALHVAGVLSLEDALGFVVDRTELMQTHGLPGRTLMVLSEESAVRPLLAEHAGRVVIASHNSPHSLVLSGDPESVGRVEDALRARRIVTRDLQTTRAAHSPLMDPVVPRLREAAAGLTFGPAQIPVVANATGRLLRDSDIGPDHLAGHVREAVRLREGFDRLRELGCTAFLEVGPLPTLTWMGAQCLEDDALTWAHSLRKGREDRTEMLTNLGRLQVRGVEVDWARLAPEQPARRVPVPTYPFQRTRYWSSDTIQAREARTSGRSGLSPAHHGGAPDHGDDGASPGEGHPLLGRRVHAPGFATGEQHHEARVCADDPAWVADHRAGGQTVMPATAFVELVLAAAVASGSDPPAVRDVVLHRPLVVPADGSVLLHTAVHDVSGTAPTVHIHAAALPADGTPPVWTLHAEGVVATDVAAQGAAVDLASLRTTATEGMAGAEHYQRAAEHGVAFGERFRAVTDVWTDPAGGLGLVQAGPALADDLGRYHLHPALLDACLQIVVALATEPPAGRVLVPASVGRVLVAGPPPPEVWSRVELHAVTEDTVDASVTILDGTGIVVATVEHLRLVATELARLGATDPAVVSRLLHHTAWQPDASPPQTAPPTRTPDPVVLRMDQEPTAAGARQPDPVAAVSAAVMAFSRAVTDLAGSDRPLVVLTHAGQAARPGERPGPAQAAIWGVAAVARREHPELGLTVIDIDDAPSAPDVAVAWAAAGRDQPFAAVRGGQVLVPRLRRGAGAAVDAAGTVALDPTATYLVGGGLGSLGLVTARLLADRGARHLVLVSRGAGDHADDPGVRALAEEGVTVRLAAVDLTDAGAVRWLVGEVDTPEHPLRGVVHAAGVIDDALIARHTPTQVADVCAAKVGGAWALHDATMGCDLTHFVVFASIASVLGGAGQGSYAAANAALGALVASRVADGLPGMCIGWGSWAGTAERLDPRHAARLADMGQDPLSTPLGVRALDVLLAGAASHPVVAAIRWQDATGDLDVPLTADLVTAARRSAGRSADGGVHDGRADGRRADGGLALQTGDPAAASAQLEGLARTHVAALCGLAAPGDIDVDRGFADLGLDSMGAVELRNRLQRDLGHRLPATLAFTHPTIRTLTAHLCELLIPAGAPAPEGLGRLTAAELADLLEAELADGAAGGQR
ncbi:MAG TPA: amino acid adenylation domain-containing protein [Euzebya sp.]|nr:amino acid adenylation domain-containing protein [Euzebya sp.]